MCSALVYLKIIRELLFELNGFSTLKYTKRCLRSVREVPRLVFKVSKRTKVFIAPSATLEVDGSLVIGVNWPNTLAGTTCFMVANTGSFKCHGNLKIYAGSFIVVEDGASLVVNDGYLNNDCRVECFQSIRIGRGVMIGNGVVIRDSDNHEINPNRPISAPIHIGDRVWIGARAMILKGVTIGDGAVIAAGSIVTRDVPSRALAAGVPARVIKNNVDWK